MLVHVISFLAEIICVDWHVVADRGIDACVKVVIAYFYHVYDAWVMRETLTVFSGAYCS